MSIELLPSNLENYSGYRGQHWIQGKVEGYIDRFSTRLTKRDRTSSQDQFLHDMGLLDQLTATVIVLADHYKSESDGEKPVIRDLNRHPLNSERARKHFGAKERRTLRKKKKFDESDFTPIMFRRALEIAEQTDLTPNKWEWISNPGKREGRYAGIRPWIIVERDGYSSDKVLELAALINTPQVAIRETYNKKEPHKAKNWQKPDENRFSELLTTQDTPRLDEWVRTRPALFIDLLQAIESTAVLDAIGPEGLLKGYLE